MLELFARQPDMLILKDDSHLTQIPISEEASSLSAILLDDGYYDFLHRYERKIEGVSIFGTEALIPLKANAWLDLKRRKAAGENIDSRDIKKHKNDVLRLYRILPPAIKIDAPEVICCDLDAFLRQVESEWNNNLLHTIGIRGIYVAGVTRTIRNVYGA